MKRFSICVMMSTYNGEKYVLEQIESILNQQGVDIQLIIRDDGSTDNTKRIIKNMNYSNVKLIEGENVGYERSFMWLVKNSIDADYYCFADQDDVWFKDKLVQGIKKIDTYMPMLYCSNVIYTDEMLNSFERLDSRQDNYFDNICKILNHSAQGCTMIFNKKLRDIVIQYDSKKIWPHDYWITTVALFVGRVIYDSRPHMYYRQHDRSVTGNRKKRKSILFIIKNYRNRLKNCPYSSLAKEIYAGYKTKIEEDDLIMLKALCDYKTNFSNKMYLLMNNGFKKDTIGKTLVLKFMVLINAI